MEYHKLPEHIEHLKAKLDKARELYSEVAHKENLQAESNRETKHCQLQPVGKPVLYTVMQKCCKQCNSRNNETYSKRLNGKDDKNRFIHARSDNTES